jgi:hypothetical protein
MDMEKTGTPFEFGQCTAILKATGKKAKDLRGLRSAMEGPSGDSLYHHIYQYLLSGHTRKGAG